MTGDDLVILRPRAPRALAGVLALAAVPALAGTAGHATGAVAVRAASPTLYVDYHTDCTFTLTLDGGATAVTIAPGTYQVFVSTPYPFADDPPAKCGYPQFSLTGPGVDLATDLSGGGETTSQLTATFVASTTYVAQDKGQPALSRKTFATSATGSTASSSSTASSESTVTSSGSKSSGTPSVDVVGSALGTVTLRGALDGTVNTGGALTLTRNGKGVTNLRSGRYTIVVDDRTAKSGFVLQEVRKSPVTVTGVSFVGRRRATIVLRAGQWLFYSPAGKKNYFVVSA